MNKKHIASACVALVGLSAFAVAQAQTNVTLYGLVDYGYTYRWDGKSAIGNSAASSSSQLNGGQAEGNRIGFKGTEDLGNGLKAVFLLEQGFMSDTGEQASSNSSFSRQAYAGLKSDTYGTVVGGRLYTPHYTFVSSLDPFHAGTVGRYNNVYSPGGASVSMYGTVMDPIRVDNALTYISPSFGGVTAQVLFSNNAAGQEASYSNSANNTLYAGLVQYNTDNLSVGVNYHYGAAGTAGLAAPLSNVQNVAVGGSYDFKVAKVMALYSYNDLSYSGVKKNTDGNMTVNNYMLGVSVPYNRFTGKASYIYSDGNSIAGGNAQQLALGVDYNLSKRTALYTAYSFIDNQDGRYNAVSDASNSGAYVGNSSVGVYQQGVQAGLRHAF